MKIVQLVDEDFINYKKPSMLIGFPTCTFKCDKECGKPVCQNSALASADQIDIPVGKLVNRYINNPITKAVVMQGLEPMDSFNDLFIFISILRDNYGCNDDIVIYTGYQEDEIPSFVYLLSKYKNIIIKFGRFIPNQKSHFDKILGVNLASNNQYAKRIDND